MFRCPAQGQWRESVVKGTIPRKADLGLLWFKLASQAGACTHLLQDGQISILKIMISRYSWTDVSGTGAADVAISHAPTGHFGKQKLNVTV
jgi:hypothetical protein